MKLVAVTRILNEDDIVEAFVRHHATIVDHHLFLDNGSTDETLTILKALKDEGVSLTVLQNKTPFFTEVSYNTSLFRQARIMFAADWVIFLDTDEFIDARLASAGARHEITSLPHEVTCISLPSFTYYDLPGDNAEEPVVPVRMRSRLRVTDQPVAKVFVRGQLADAGATIEAGQHEAILNGEPIVPVTAHKLALAHYYRRSAWQEISKSVMGHLKVVAAGKQEREKKRSFHYGGVFTAMRDDPEDLFKKGYLQPAYETLDLISDPIAYLGGPLRYTPTSDAMFKAVRVMIAYAEQLAENHAHFIDTNQGVRLQAEQATSRWVLLI